jgi:hypothetical protein
MVSISDGAEIAQIQVTDTNGNTELLFLRPRCIDWGYDCEIVKPSQAPEGSDFASYDAKVYEEPVGAISTDPALLGARKNIKSTRCAGPDRRAH